MAPASTLAAAAETWVWNQSLGVYYQAASDMYALPSDNGWTYLTPIELAARGETSTTPAGTGSAPADLEEGEVEDDVGWGGLMDPEKLARVVDDDLRKKDGKNKAYEPNSHEREQRHPAYSNGYGSRDKSGDQSVARDLPGERYGSRQSTFELEYTDRDDSRSTRASSLDEKNPSNPSSHILRLIVRRSKDLEHGSVAVLDAREGGIQIGRDRCERGATARIRVREMEVSKTHAVVYWGLAGDENDEDGGEGWWIVDMGSTLGTYVAHRGERDATRLSEPKSSSQPYPLRHLSVITVGTTTFVAHVHDDWPCTECQLAGNSQLALDEGVLTATGEGSPAPSLSSALLSGQTRGDRQLKRKLELTALKDTLLGAKTETGTRNLDSARYFDRSAQRRRLHGSSPPRSSTPPVRATSTGTATISAGPSIASRAMLAKHGWTEGQGLGRAGMGRAEPIVPTLRNERAGLGSKGEKKDVEVQGDGGWKARGMRRRWDEVAR